MLLSCEEFVDNPEKFHWTLLARVVSHSRDCHNLRLRQYFSEFFLSRRRNNRAASAQYINNRRFDLADEPPKLCRYEAIPNGGIALPNDSSIGTRLRSVMHVSAKNLVSGSRIARLLLSEQLVFGCPSLFVFPPQTSRHSVSDFSGALGTDVFRNDGRHQIGMESSKHLRDTTAGGIAPDHDVPKTKLLGETFNVFHIIFDKVCAFRVPIRISVPTHIHRHHVIPWCEMRRNVIKGMGDTTDAVQHD